MGANLFDSFTVIENKKSETELIEIKQGLRVRRRIGKDKRVGTIMEVLHETKAYIKWDEPTVNTFNGSKQWHSTIDKKSLELITAPNAQECDATDAKL